MSFLTRVSTLFFVCVYLLPYHSMLNCYIDTEKMEISEKPGIFFTSFGLFLENDRGKNNPNQTVYIL